MGSTITAQTLKVAINETITLGGVVRNGSTSVNIGSVGAIISGITTVANKASTENNTILAAFGNAAAAETAVAILPTAVKYVRVTNLDDTNSIYLAFKNGTSHVFVVEVAAGQSYVTAGTKIDANGGDINTHAPTLEDCTLIDASGNGGAVDVEYYIATS
jgi:hypothetical protein